MKPHNHGQKPPKIRPTKPSFTVFRCEGEYPTAKAALVEYFPISPEAADALIHEAEQGQFPLTQIIFTLPKFGDGMVLGVLFSKKRGTWRALVGARAATFPTRDKAERFTRKTDQLARASGIAVLPWVILGSWQPATVPARVH